MDLRHHGIHGDPPQLLRVIIETAHSRFSSLLHQPTGRRLGNRIAAGFRIPFKALGPQEDVGFLSAQPARKLLLVGENQRSHPLLFRQSLLGSKECSNPLYHWSHLELARYFGISDRLVNPETARGIYEECNSLLADPGFSCRGLMRKSKVEVVCTTDDPVDTLAHHAAIASDASFEIQVRPTWRPDKALIIDQPAGFSDWIDLLEQASGISISTLSDLMEALANRHDFFAAHGCRLSDRGVDTVWAEDCTESEAASIFAKARSGGAVTAEDAVCYKSYLLHELAVMDAAKGWTMQIHYGALRGANTRMKRLIGADCGFDSIGDQPVAAALAKHLDRLDLANCLPKTIIYNLNPRDNELVATMLGNFQDGITPGKIQFGSGWWFLDQLDGMTRQIESLSQLGLLSQFVGMLTDSRSFLSYTRHEYFRRLLCNILGNDMERGLLPSDFPLVGQMVADISYHNARRYFGFYEK